MQRHYAAASFIAAISGHAFFPRAAIAIWNWSCPAGWAKDAKDLAYHAFAVTALIPALLVRYLFYKCPIMKLPRWKQATAQVI